MSGSTGRRALVLALSAVAMVAVARLALAQRQSAQERRQQQVAQIPVCAQPLGAISLIEPEAGRSWWTGQQLPAPSRSIKVFVTKSRCFTLVDRGAGLNAAMQERVLGDSGELRNRSSVGSGQMKAAAYVMGLDLIGAYRDAGGKALS